MRSLRLIILILFFVLLVAFLTIFLLRNRSGTFTDNFNNGINPSWAPKTPEKWELVEDGGEGFYRLKEPGKCDAGVIRPAEYSLVQDLIFGDFTLKCKVRCDAPSDRRYRDVVIIFGYKDDTHFYYVHLSNISDSFHNAIMMVNGDSRHRLNRDMPEATLTDLDFHDVKLVRDIRTGDIKVYFDGKLIMEAQDTTFTLGKIGVGSVDDVGSFDDVRIKGKILGGSE